MARLPSFTDPKYCAHDNEDLIDDSFDHEYGTEQIFYYRCPDCGTTRDADRSSGDSGFYD